MIKCEICEHKHKPKKNGLIKTFRQHLKGMHFEDLKCSECDNIFARTSLKQHMRHRHGDINHELTCHVCQKRLRKLSFEKHFKEQHTEIALKRFPCPHCGKSFKTEIYKKNHVKEKHTIGEKDYKCNKCEFQTNIKDRLRSHNNYTHTSEMPFQCHECSKFLKNATSLRNHIAQTHTREESMCVECGKSFQNKLKLAHHVKQVHMFDESKVLTCPQCPSTHKFKYSLLRHIETVHDGARFPCNLCDYQATQQTNLTVHIKWKHKKLQN